MLTKKALKLFIDSKTGAKSPATVRWYQSKLDPLITYLTENGITQIEKCTVFDLNAWRADLSTQENHYQNHPNKKPVDGPVCQETLRGYVRAARTWFKWMHEEVLILQTNPAAKFALPPRVKKRKEGISEDARNQLIAAAANHERDHAILRFFADTACRLGGIAGLTLDRLHLSDHRAYVLEKGLGGMNKGRLVYYGPETAHALATWLVVRPEVPGCDTVFVGYKRGGKKQKKAGWVPLTEEGIYRMIQRYADKVGILLSWNPHSWRHGAARAMTRRGLPLQTLSQILGHSSIQVTADIYGTLDDDEIQVMHDAFSPLKPQAIKFRVSSIQITSPGSVDS
jgi:site-specific recombinase XerD